MSLKIPPKLSAGRPSTRKNKSSTLSSLSNNDDIKRVNFNLSTSEHTKLKIYAAKQGKSITELLVAYVKSLPDE